MSAAPVELVRPTLTADERGRVARQARVAV
jgi:hypothetical protein